jgi:hypothetical protein
LQLRELVSDECLARVQHLGGKLHLHDPYAVRA